MIYYYLALTLFVFGLAGLIFKRDIISILISQNISLMGIFLIFLNYALAIGDAKGPVLNYLLLFIFCIQSVVGLGVIFLFYKKRKLMLLDGIGPELD